jgi:phosphoribosylformylglycinamidine synthase I
MKLEDIRVAILRMEGTNCEDESYQAFARLGAKPEYVHIKQMLGLVEGEERSPSDYQIIMFPGGFSAGDYIRAGAIFASIMKSRLMDELKEFVRAGYPVLGVCNGFQVLVELGMLPAIDGISKHPEAVLATNDSNRFECRNIYIRNDRKSPSPFTSFYEKGEVLLMPVAHAEGKFMVDADKEKEIMKKLNDNDQIVFRYVDPENPDKEDVPYPWNPNGAIENIAGISNPEGNVLGMMPHPERAYYNYMLGLPNPDDFGPGAGIFRSVLDYVEKRF